MRRPVVLNCLRVRRRPWVRYNRGAFVLSSTLVESKIIVFELHGVKTDVWWWSSWTKVVFFVGKEDIFLIPLFQRTIFSSSSSRIKIFSNHAARTPLPSPQKENSITRWSMVKKERKRTRVKNDFSFVFARRYRGESWSVSQRHHQQSFFLLTRRTKLFSKNYNTQQNVCHASENWKTRQ